MRDTDFAAIKFQSFILLLVLVIWLRPQRWTALKDLMQKFQTGDIFFKNITYDIGLFYLTTKLRDLNTPTLFSKR